jgi:hypothetical protein
MPSSRLFAIAIVLFCASAVRAKPTYRLDVKNELKPRATLSLAGGKVVRSSVTDDPGFRLQLHFKKDGKTVAQVDARAETSVALPETAVGTYTVALELFHPAYKGGNASKGEFKAISDVLTYRVETQKPLKVSVVAPAAPPPAPAQKKEAAPKGK